MLIYDLNAPDQLRYITHNPRTDDTLITVKYPFQYAHNVLGAQFAYMETLIDEEEYIALIPCRYNGFDHPANKLIHTISIHDAYDIVKTMHHGAMDYYGLLNSSFPYQYMLIKMLKDTKLYGDIEKYSHIKQKLRAYALNINAVQFDIAHSSTTNNNVLVDLFAYIEAVPEIYELEDQNTPSNTKTGIFKILLLPKRNVFLTITDDPFIAPDVYASKEYSFVPIQPISISDILMYAYAILLNKFLLETNGNTKKATEIASKYANMLMQEVTENKKKLGWSQIISLERVLLNKNKQEVSDVTPLDYVRPELGIPPQIRISNVLPYDLVEKMLTPDFNKTEQTEIILDYTVNPGEISSDCDTIAREAFYAGIISAVFHSAWLLYPNVRIRLSYGPVYYKTHNSDFIMDDDIFYQYLLFDSHTLDMEEIDALMSSPIDIVLNSNVNPYYKTYENIIHIGYDSILREALLLPDFFISPTVAIN